VKIDAETIPSGALPMWHPNSGFPIFSLRNDGKSVMEPPFPERVLLQTFELAAGDRDSLRDMVVDRVKSLCLAAGFPGRAHVIIVGDSVTSFSDRVICSVELGIGYTWDHDVGTPGLRTRILACDIPDEIGDDAFTTVDLLRLDAGLVVMSVMGE